MHSHLASVTNWGIHTLLAELGVCRTLQSIIELECPLESLIACCCRFGGSCARYVKADLPLLNSSSSANVLIILAVGISLAVLGGVLLALAAAIIVRQRRQLRGYRRMPRSAHTFLSHSCPHAVV